MHSTAAPMTTQTQVFTLPATGAPQEIPRVADARGVASFLAQALGLQREVATRSAVAAADRQPGELGIRTAAHPVLRSRDGRGLQIGTSLLDTVQAARAVPRLYRQSASSPGILVRDLSPALSVRLTGSHRPGPRGRHEERSKPARAPRADSSDRAAEAAGAPEALRRSAVRG